MKLLKVYNNNVVLADADGQEAVVIGRGIGFQKHRDDLLDQDKIIKVYTPADSDSDWLNHFRELMADIDPIYFEIANEIITQATELLNTKFSSYLLISLTDHIHFAVYRQQHNIEIKNEILWEIIRIYPKEYQVGQLALDLIEAKLQVRLPDDEAGFIGIKFVESSLNDVNGNQTQFMTEIINGSLDIIKYQLRIDVDVNSLSYQRLVTHLRFFVMRVMDRDNQESMTTDTILYQHIINKYPAAWECVKKITNFIEAKIKQPVSFNEQVYLTIHVQRIIDEISHR